MTRGESPRLQPWEDVKLSFGAEDDDIVRKGEEIIIHRESFEPPA